MPNNLPETLLNFVLFKTAVVFAPGVVGWTSFTKKNSRKKSSHQTSARLIAVGRIFAR